MKARTKNFLSLLIITAIIAIGFSLPTDSVQAQEESVSPEVKDVPSTDEPAPLSGGNWVKCYVQVSYEQEVQVTGMFGVKRTKTVEETRLLAFIGKDDGSMDPGLTIINYGDYWISNAYPYPTTWSTGDTVIPAEKFDIETWGMYPKSRRRNWHEADAVADQSHDAPLWCRTLC